MQCGDLWLGSDFCRFALACFFWSHALLFYYVPKLPLQQWATALDSSPTELGGLIILGVFSIASMYGTGQLALDALYVFCFPFIIFYEIGETVRLGRLEEGINSGGVGGCNATFAPIHTGLDVPPCFRSA